MLLVIRQMFQRHYRTLKVGCPNRVYPGLGVLEEPGYAPTTKTRFLNKFSPGLARSVRFCGARTISLVLDSRLSTLSDWIRSSVDGVVCRYKLNFLAEANSTSVTFRVYRFGTWVDRDRTLFRYH